MQKTKDLVPSTPSSYLNENIAVKFCNFIKENLVKQKSLMTQAKSVSHEAVPCYRKIKTDFQAIRTQKTKKLSSSELYLQCGIVPRPEQSSP